MIFDEVFVGFRLGIRGAQEYFGVPADLVTYGKTLGGGLPVGVVCGRKDLMRRFHEERPAEVCFARGTFNSHPYVMAAMHEFLLGEARVVCHRENRCALLPDLVEQHLPEEEGAAGSTPAAGTVEAARAGDATRAAVCCAQCRSE